ncbi:NADH:flavin oxidoreductase/NADH oxidase [Halomonas organivorans]|uniref:2,4-dienoyl-CoA reductase-like NADH-dependent reductase (Old Yellow Enzyme family) n=1 Tax=Halomonas organivorans TaxID=257772 RepID=A0A7W5BVK9_9GAMM|nr:NADH:flavin oxidoreductase/NADH oxidase [Halomonas organivorans]MBB3139875.1 2,4-dienoyl-CoA reductase-like NADH-dependent reductase (Old Yellow Enzyme family) [Halomonas organivorans]
MTVPDTHESPAMDGPALLRPLTLRGLTLKNRMVVSPMCQHSAVDGAVQDWHVVHYGKFVLGGAALVLTESTAVSSDSRVGVADLGIWSDDHVAGLKRLGDFAHANGAAFGIQLAHAGRKAFSEPLWEGGRALSPETLDARGISWRRVGPSAIAASGEWTEPEMLKREEIEAIRHDFVTAAERADRAGADVVELHFGHGYLLASFLSPLSNQRTDEYGGSLENRMRFAVETARAVREAWPDDKPLFARLSCLDGAEGSWGMEDTVALAKALKEVGVDVIDCSSGGLTEETRRSNVPRGIGFQVPFAEEVRRRAGIKTQAVGIILTPEQANEVVDSGKADLVALGREVLRTPYWPAEAIRALNGAEDFSAWPLQHREWLARRHTALSRLGVTNSDEE